MAEVHHAWFYLDGATTFNAALSSDPRPADPHMKYPAYDSSWKTLSPTAAYEPAITTQLDQCRAVGSVAVL